MTDLPNTSPQTDDTMISGVGSGAKENEPVLSPDGLKDATGQEFELPKEVSSVGVRIHPTSIPIPPTVAQMGVKPAGQNIPVQTVPAVVLPLSDEQIAIGLHKGITDSLRWLSEWCVRRLKQMHIAVIRVHGKLVRTKV